MIELSPAAAPLIGGVDGVGVDVVRAGPRRQSRGMCARRNQRCDGSERRGCEKMATADQWTKSGHVILPLE